MGIEADAGPATSLRTARPTWAKTKTSTNEPRQRIIVYMAGGATYSESRACYEISRKAGKDVVLVTSHMLTPALFLRQVGDLSKDKRRLGIPADAPKKEAPAHLFEREEVHAPPAAAAAAAPGTAGKAGGGGQVPTQAMAGMKLDGPRANGGTVPPPQPHTTLPAMGSSGKLTKDPDKKKKHHFFGSSKNK